MVRHERDHAGGVIGRSSLTRIRARQLPLQWRQRSHAPDHRFAWPRLSDTDNERAGGTTASLLLAGFGCPAGLGRIELAGGVLAGALYASRVERVRAHRR